MTAPIPATIRSCVYLLPTPAAIPASQLTIPGSWPLPDIPLRLVPGVRVRGALPRPSVGQQ